MVQRTVISSLVLIFHIKVTLLYIDLRSLPYLGRQLVSRLFIQFRSLIAQSCEKSVRTVRYSTELSNSVEFSATATDQFLARITPSRSPVRFPSQSRRTRTDPPRSVRAEAFRGAESRISKSNVVCGKNRTGTVQNHSGEQATQVNCNLREAGEPMVQIFALHAEHITIQNQLSQEDRETVKRVVFDR